MFLILLFHVEYSLKRVKLLKSTYLLVPLELKYQISRSHRSFKHSYLVNHIGMFFLFSQLKAPRDGWSKKIGVSYSRGGEYGNRKQEINALIERCM